MDILVADKVDKTYLDERTLSKVMALRGLSLSIQEGQFVCIVGPSGCGKTTFLHMVAGLSPVTSGTITVDGRQVRRPGADRGMVFQDYALFPWKTVAENVEFGPKVRGVRAKERAELSRKLLQTVGLDDFRDRFPKDLSGGMKQRVGVARALANEPRLLLMDEPFASVDAMTRMELQEETTRLWATLKTTVIFVTHSVEEAVFLADRVLVFGGRPGRLTADLAVDIDRPRKWTEMETDAQFNALRKRVVDEVHSI